MKKMMAMAAMIAGLSAFATSFSYQGVLKSATGTTLSDKNHTIEFRLYDGPTSDTALWGRSSAVLLDDDGLFTVELSDSTGSALDGLTDELDDVLAKNAGGTIYIGLTVSGSSGEIRPRQKLLAVPLAAFASDVDTAKNDFTVNGTATFKNAKFTGTVEMNGTNTIKTLVVNNLATFAGEAKFTGDLTATHGITIPSGATMTQNDVVGGIVPKGGIILWSGAADAIPSGWALCDGNNDTPDLRNRFVVGAGSNYGVGDNGGAAEVTLTTDQIPSHNHTYAGDDQLRYGGGNWAWGTTGYDAKSETSGNNGFYYTSSVGGGKSHENRPPYYALCYIMKL